MAKNSGLMVFRAPLLVGIVSLALLLSAPAAPAAEKFDEPTIRALLKQLNDAAAARDIGPWEARLAPECDVAVQVNVFGTLKTTHFSRREYLEMTTRIWSELAKQKIGYTYVSAPLTIRFESGGNAAVVSGKATETMTYPDGQKLVTSSLSTMRIEVRGERLMIVSVNAVGES